MREINYARSLRFINEGSKLFGRIYLKDFYILLLAPFYVSFIIGAPLEWGMGAILLLTLFFMASLILVKRFLPVIELLGILRSFFGLRRKGFLIEVKNDSKPTR